MFVYEGRTSSMLSATASATAYSTFNPLASRSFGDTRFSLGMTALNEEWICRERVTRSIDEVAALTTTTVTHISPEEKHYIQLLALAQMGGRLAAGRFLRCEAPAVVINQAGATETTGVNWLLPVAAKDSYQSFFSARVNDQSYCVAPREALPQRVRLWARSEWVRRRRGRVGRGGRIVIDRVSESKPGYGDLSHEVYRGTLPVSAVRARPSRKAESSIPGIVLPGASDIAAPALPVLPGMSAMPALPAMPAMPALPSVSAAATVPVVGAAPSLPPFNRTNPECATSVKRTFQEVMQDQNHVSFCNCENALSFNLSSEMMVHVEPVKRMILSRNNVNDQIQFFL